MDTRQETKCKSRPVTKTRFLDMVLSKRPSLRPPELPCLFHLPLQAVLAATITELNARAGTIFVIARNLYPDSPFNVVNVFSFSYRYLPFLVDFFTYSLTLYDGVILFSDDYWIQCDYWLWSEKIKKNTPKIDMKRYIHDKCMTIGG